MTSWPRRVVSKAVNTVGLGSDASAALNRMKYLVDRDLRRDNARLAQTAPDAYTLPPPGLVFLVTGEFDLNKVYSSGADEIGRLRSALQASDVDAARLRRVLDFGCGSGRLI